MSDRLRELLRQRALLQEHVEWLDREIAAVRSSASAGPESRVEESASPVAVTAATRFASVGAPAPTSDAETAQGAFAEVSATPTAAIPPEVAAADAIIEEYRVPPETLRTDVRKGCLLYFFTALGLLALAVVALYFAYHHD
jgi:hypothetical protein